MQSIKTIINTVRQEIVTAITQPRTQLTRYQRMLRYCFDLAKHARRELRDHSAPTMAAALTYRTIFGLVPMLVMAMIVFRAFGGFGSTQEGITRTIYNLLEIQIDAVETADSMERETAGLKDQDPSAEDADTDTDTDADPDPAANPDAPAPIDDPDPDFSTPPDPADPDNATDPGDPAAAPDASEGEPGNDQQQGEQAALDQLGNSLDSDAAEQDVLTSEDMKQKIDQAVSALAGRASNISIGSIGVVGTVILIWAALGLIVTVERNFNVIFNAPSGRRWHVRIPIYWAVITLGPVLIWASFYFSTQFLDASRTVPGVGWLIGIANRFFALVVTWLLVFILYKLMPNTRVAVRPALIGAFVAALCWEGMKAALRWYIDNAVASTTQTALYGQLALIPILLLWIYITWMIVLAGLEITHLIQTLPASRMGEHEPTIPTHTGDPWLVIPVLAAVADAFSRGESMTADDIANRLKLPINAVDDVARDLSSKGLLHLMSQDDGHPKLLLAQPPENIRIHELIDSNHPSLAHDAPGYDLLMQVAEAQRKALENARFGVKGSTPNDAP